MPELCDSWLVRAMRLTRSRVAAPNRVAQHSRTVEESDERMPDPGVHLAMSRKLKEQMKAFRASAPGQRFQDSYKRRRNDGEKTMIWRVLNLAIAAVAFILGIVFSLLPVIPGFVFFFLTAVLVASESRRVARFLDRLEVKLRGAWKWLRRRSGAKIPLR